MNFNYIYLLPYYLYDNQIYNWETIKESLIHHMKI